MKHTLTTLAVFLFLAVSVQGAEAQPNIIFIMADDQGYGDASSYNPESKIPTPGINRIAKEGIRFTDAHSQPLCTASRVQIMTGIHNNRNYLNFTLLDPEAVTFATSEFDRYCRFTRRRRVATSPANINK